MPFQDELKATRRRFLAIGSGAAAFGCVTPAEAAEEARRHDAELMNLAAAFATAVAAQEVAVADSPSDMGDDDFFALLKPCKDLAERIALLPAATLAGLTVKARALLWCRGGELGDMRDAETTDERILISTMRDLLALSDASESAAFERS